MRREEALLAEYNALRAEILVHIQAQTTLVSIALTATAAVGGVAFGGEGGDRFDILLVLPIILSGLGLSYLKRSQNSHLLGHYIRQRLWPTLQGSVHAEEVDDIPSWEASVYSLRKFRDKVASPSGYLSFFPGFFVFGAPSVAALVLNRNEAPDWELLPWNPEGGPLETAWAIDLFVLLVSGALMVAVAFAARGNPFSSPAESTAAAPARTVGDFLILACLLGWAVLTILDTAEPLRLVLAIVGVALFVFMLVFLRSTGAGSNGRRPA